MRPKHPSGRPIRKEELRRLGFVRLPNSEPLTPGLRKISLANPVGFTVDLLSNERRHDDLLAKKLNNQ